MTQRALWWGGLVVLVGIIGYIAYTSSGQYLHNGSAGATISSSFDRTLSDGVITTGYPSAEMGLATTQAQVLVHAYIPPCDQGFDYCLYYTGGAYAGTNFESAGFRIQKRPDLTTQNTCLETPPAGYDAHFAPHATSTSATHAASVFIPLGDAGAGHYAEGALYRLFIPGTSTCYEFESRIGETQFANYPPGAIKLFTDADRQQMEMLLTKLVRGITVSGEADLFPHS